MQGTAILNRGYRKKNLKTKFMLDNEGISERNQKLIKFVTGLNLGIHIIGLPEQPRFVSEDYKYLLNGFVKNFKIILNNKEYDGEVILQCRVDDNPNDYRELFVEWINAYEHKRIYTINYIDGLMISGYGHHDKINKTNPYPVFARYFPHFYYEIEKAEEIQERFKEYNLEIK